MAPPCSGPGVTVQSSPAVSTSAPSARQRGGHQLGVARAQRAAYDAGAVGERGEHQRPVGQRLRAGQRDRRPHRRPGARGGPGVGGGSGWHGGKASEARRPRCTRTLVEVGRGVRPSLHGLHRRPHRRAPPGPPPDHRLPRPPRPEPGRHPRPGFRRAGRQHQPPPPDARAGRRRRARSGARHGRPHQLVAAHRDLSISWSPDDFSESPADLHRARAAEKLNFEHQVGKFVAWKRRSGAVLPGVAPRRLQQRQPRDGDPRRALDLLDRLRADPRAGWRDEHRPGRRAVAGAGLPVHARLPGRSRDHSAPSTAPPRPSAPARPRRPRLARAAGRLSDAGDQLWTIALAWTAVHVASPAAAGLVVAAGTVPRALVLLLGGVVADRYDARRVMVLANGARIAVLVGHCRWVSRCPARRSRCCSWPPSRSGSPTPSTSRAPRRSPGSWCGPLHLPAYAGAGQTADPPRLHGRRRGRRLPSSPPGGWAAAPRWTRSRSSVVVGFLVVWLRPRYPLPRAAAEPALRQHPARVRAPARTSRSTRTLVIALSGLNLFVAPGRGRPARAAGPGGGLGRRLGGRLPRPAWSPRRRLGVAGPGALGAPGARPRRRSCCSPCKASRSCCSGSGPRG